VEEAGGAKHATRFADGCGSVLRRKMEERGAGPHSGHGTIPKWQVAGVGLNPRPRELWKACPQHSERQIQGDGPKPETPKLGRVAAGPGPEIKDRGPGTEVVDETPKPQRDHRAIPGVLEEPARDPVVCPACAINSVVHVSRGLTSALRRERLRESPAVLCNVRAFRCCQRCLYRYATQQTFEAVIVIPFDAATAMVKFIVFLGYVSGPN
jgi:hypothetical protein